MGHALGRSVTAVPGVDVARVEAKHPRELFHHHVEDEFAQLVLVVRAGHERPPVHTIRGGS